MKRMTLVSVVATSCLMSTAGLGIAGESMDEVISRMAPYVGPSRAGVDTSTLAGKVMCGYQGWFSADGDGAGRGWTHYAKGRTAPRPGHCTFDLWPDMSEMDDDEAFGTPFKHMDGSTALLQGLILSAPGPSVGTLLHRRPGSMRKPTSRQTSSGRMDTVSTIFRWHFRASAGTT